MSHLSTRLLSSSIPRSLFRTGTLPRLSSTTTIQRRTFSDHNPFISPGSPPTVVPTNWENLTGKARIEYEAELKGKKVLKYLDYDGNDVYTPTRMGTKEDPMMIKAYGDVQYVGCSGYPTESHDNVWVSVYEEGHDYWHWGYNRCTDCGMVFKLDRIDPDAGEEWNNHDHSHNHTEAHEHKSEASH